MLIHFSNLVVVDCTTPDQQQQREDGSLSSSPVFPAVARFAVGGPQNNVWRMFSPIEKEKVQKTRRNTTIKLFWAVQLMAESLITTNDESSVVGRSFFTFFFFFLPFEQWQSVTYTQRSLNAKCFKHFSHRRRRHQVRRP